MLSIHTRNILVKLGFAPGLRPFQVYSDDQLDWPRISAAHGRSLVPGCGKRYSKAVHMEVLRALIARNVVTIRDRLDMAVGAKAAIERMQSNSTRDKRLQATGPTPRAVIDFENTLSVWRALSGQPDATSVSLVDVLEALRKEREQVLFLRQAQAQDNQQIATLRNTICSMNETEDILSRAMARANAETIDKEMRIKRNANR